MKRKAFAATILAAVAMLGLSAPARAAGGVIEINQAVVNAAGGFPYTISTAGSYRLSGNLLTPTATDAIDVSALNVTIDLNGFWIEGLGAGNGIEGNYQTTVENGTVGGFANGVVVGISGTVRSVHADGNTASGISTGNNAVIKDSTANANTGGSGVTGASGIIVGDNAVIEGCTVNSNTSYGIFAGMNVRIEGSTANSNFDGISVKGDAVIEGSTASNNGNIGILAIDSAVIRGNTASANTTSGYGIECSSDCAISGNTANDNGQGIIVSGQGNLILQNTVSNNSHYGINNGGGTTNGYGQNVMYNDSIGPVFSGTSMGNNLCSGTVC